MKLNNLTYNLRVKLIDEMERKLDYKSNELTGKWKIKSKNLFICNFKQKDWTLLTAKTYHQNRKEAKTKSNIQMLYI